MSGTGGEGPEPAVRSRLLSAHGETLRGVIAAGRSVAAPWEAEAVSEAETVTRPLSDAIAAAGLSPDLLAALGDGASALGAGIAGEPVPAPPYLVVTSRGPVCRATLDDGRRLVVTFVLFGVDRRPPCYRFLDPTPSELLDVRLR